MRTGADRTRGHSIAGMAVDTTAQGDSIVRHRHPAWRPTLLKDGGEEQLSRYVTATAMARAAPGQPGSRPGGERRFGFRTLTAYGTDLEDFDEFEDDFDDDELDDDDLDDGFQDDDLGDDADEFDDDDDDDAGDDAGNEDDDDDNDDDDDGDEFDAMFDDDENDLDDTLDDSDDDELDLEEF